MAGPGESFPAGDPRNAIYWETVGKLEHQRDLRKTGYEEALKKEQAGATLKEGQLSQAEPNTYAANRYRGVREGVASSGVNTERRGGIATNYANRRYAVQLGLKEGEGRIHKGEQQSRETFEQGKQQAARDAQERAREYLEKNPPTPPPTAAYNPGGERTVLGPPGPGGVVPYEEHSPAGFVRVGAAQPIKWSRDPAVRRLQAQRGY